MTRALRDLTDEAGYPPSIREIALITVSAELNGQAG
ncbi:hypothetical protein IPZ61_00150 [Streptomyces sioyaensis]|nr:hypothetical protein [Streptomyces sioyaensis]